MREILLMICFFLFIYAVSPAQGKISGCVFPDNVGVFKHLKEDRSYYTIISIARDVVIMVKVIFSNRRDITYRTTCMVSSTKTNTVGKDGVLLELLDWRGDYFPSLVLYQLSPQQVLFFHKQH